MSNMTFGERKALVAALLDKPHEDILGYVLIGLTADGSVTTSSGKNSAIIIATLADVIAGLATSLADGFDMQAEALREKNPEAGL